MVTSAKFEYKFFFLCTVGVAIYNYKIKMEGCNSCFPHTATFLMTILTSHSGVAALTTSSPFLKNTQETKPGNVTDFTCISYDYEYMECSFTIPKNMALSNYDLEYRLPMDNSTHKCFCREIKNDKLQCNVTDYLPMRGKYLFFVKGKNDAGENIQEFPIENHYIVLPSSVDIIKRNISSSSISLSLQKLKISYYAKIGLTYDIQIRDKSSDWRTPHMGEFDCQNGICNVIVTDLYAFWLYWIKVRVKPSGVQSDNFWSPESAISFRTKAERPKKSPQTPIGGFYIDSTETLLRLYWEKTPEHEQNGPGFHYIVNEIGVDKLSFKTNESSATFTWKNVRMQTFGIKSGNDYGESIDQNLIHVYGIGSARNEVNEKSITKVYQNNSYTLSWLPPENMEELMNYTVFWCLPKIELPSQCKGPISYQYLDKFATDFTTEPKDRSLNLAISANYKNYNRGMQWARCSGDISTELMKMELEVSALNKSAILVKWNSGSVCASILKGYNMTFCRASSDDKCISPANTIEFLRDKQEYKNYTLSDIPPYTNVCLYMFMYSSNKQGRRSDLYCTRTKASAPSAPRDVEYLKNTVTSKSAQIKWSPPDVLNGVLSHFTVHWRRYPDQIFEKKTISADQTFYNLTGLNSYSSYEAYVTANTTEESIPSAHIQFTTLIGIPSGPRNLNIYENDTTIRWEQPDLPSGSRLFYVVALIRWDEKFNPIYERLSIVRGRSCRFQHPDCLNLNEAYTLTVRAVNVGGEEEVDRDIIGMDKDDILCSAQVDEHFCETDTPENFFDIDSIFQNDSNVFFASPWIVAPRSYSCSTSSKASLYAVALTVVIAFTFYVCCWFRNKYYKMKNIKVILPEGLVEEVSSYKFAKNTSASGSALVPSTTNDFKPDISRSSDCLVACGHQKHINLITNFNKAPSNAFLSFSSRTSSNERYGDDYNEEHPSLEATNAERNSASISHTDGYCNHQIESTTISAPRIEEIEKKYTHVIKQLCEDERTTNTNDYVVHNLQFLASMVIASGRGIDPTSHRNKALPSDGYIQPGTAK